MLKPVVSWILLARIGEFGESWPGSPSACLSVFLLFSLLCNCVCLLIKYNTIQKAKISVSLLPVSRYLVELLLIQKIICSNLNIFLL